MIDSTTAMDRPVDNRRATARRRWLVGGAGSALLLAAAALYGPASRWMSADRSVDLSRIRVGTVVRGDLERDLSVQGRIVAAFHPTMFSPASGIVSLAVRAGEVVAVGQVLAVVDSPELNSRLRQERATLSALESDLDRQRILASQERLANRQQIDLAEVELEAARRAMDRAERSREEGILNEVEYEEAQDELRRSELALDHAREDAELEHDTLEFEIRNRELSLERQREVVADLERQVAELSIRAPVDGLVSRLDVEDHDAVTPGREIVTVVDLSAFEIEVQIPEGYADDVGIGTAVEVHYDGEPYPAEVKVVSPEVEGSQVRGIVAFTGTPPEGLRQNQRVSTRLILESRSDVLIVPRGPYLEVGGGREAFVIRGDTAELRPIRVGAVGVAEVEIVDGLVEGDRIIISDTSRFTDARKVFLRQ